MKKDIGKAEETEKDIVNADRPEQTAKAPTIKRKRKIKVGMKLPNKMNVPDSALSKSELYWRAENAVRAFDTSREKAIVTWFLKNGK